MKYLFNLSILLFAGMLQAQSIKVDSIATLDSVLIESSGLLYIDGKLYTHNDSGNDPALYELDSNTGKAIRKISFIDVYNIDWEDITMDDTFVYLGDFGNNQGKRMDLKIIKFPKSALLKGTISLGTFEIISFNYYDQEDFTPSNFATNFDAEGLVVLGDSLYIFTKNWGDFKTNIYSLPKAKGNYHIKKVATINTMGMVTGATLNEDLNMVVLCGYSFTGAFITKLSNVSPNPFQSIQFDRYDINPKGSIQIEGICYAGNYKYFLSSEAFQSAPALLHQVEDKQLTNTTTIHTRNYFFYPNPSSDVIEIKTPNFTSLFILDQQGRVVLESKAKKIDISSLNKGIYTIQVLFGNGQVSISQVVKN